MGYEGLIYTEMKPALCGMRICLGATQRRSERFFVLVMGIKSQEKKENTIHGHECSRGDALQPRGAHE